MGKAKSNADLSAKVVATWTSDDVKQWLKDHESLNKYTKQLKVQLATATSRLAGIPLWLDCVWTLRREPLGRNS